MFTNLKWATHLGSFSSLLGNFLFGVIGILTIYHFWFQSTRYAKLGKRLPGPRSFPIVGHAYLAINKTPSETAQTLINLCLGKGDIQRFWFGNRLAVLLSNPEDIELILNNHLEKTPEYKLFEPWLGDGLLISKGEKWKSHRKIIAPTFHHSILKTFMPVFNKNATNLVEQLKKEAVGKVCDVHDYMNAVTVDVLLETVMGAKKVKETKSSFTYAKAVMDMCAILHYRHVRLWMRLDFIFGFTKMFRQQASLLKTIHHLADQVMKIKKLDYFERVNKGDVSLYGIAQKSTEEEISHNQHSNLGKDDLDDFDEDVGEKKRLAFLDFLIEAAHMDGNNLSDQEIRDEVNTIMFEGHDTTAAATSFFISLLGIYPEVQEKVYQELREIFQDSDRPVTFNDTLEMKYLERVLLETLRLYPPVPVIGRHIREEIKLASADYILPKGASVGISPFVVHRDPRFYPDPEKFDPDNFLPERCQHRPYYSFIPFSAGPRSCVGRKYAILKMKVLLAVVVRNFTIKSKVLEKDFVLQGDIILKRADGFRVVLEKRTNL